MSPQDLLELHKRHDDAHNKYTYFLLAVTASAVAFAIQKTQGLLLSWSMVPLGLAVVAWGFSFFCGTKNLIWAHIALGANYGLLQIHYGRHPNQPKDQAQLQGAIQGINSAIEHNIDKAQLYAVWQYRLLIAGAVLFIVWHVLEMALHTYASTT